MIHKPGHGHAGLYRCIRADTACRSTRRSFICGAVAWPALAWANAVLAQSKRPVLIGWLNMGSVETSGQALAALEEGLAALGWKEGQQYVIEARWANGKIERLQGLAEEIVAKKPAIVVAAPSQSVAAVAKAAPNMPIVHATGSDPVAAGFAVSLARPGGMITGLTNIVTDLQQKFIEILVEVVPRLKRVGFLVDSTTYSGAALVEAARRAAALHGIEPRFVETANSVGIEPALTRLAKEEVQALAVLSSPLFTFERKRIVKLALVRRWPVIAGGRRFAEEGALLSYASDQTANFMRAAFYVDRILKGAKPGDLPIEQPRRIELAVNLKTAKLLGLTIPQSVMLRADTVIE